MKRFMIKITALLLLAGLHSPMVRAAQMLVPGGQVVGLQLYNDTVTVAAFDDALGSSAQAAGLRVGDELVNIDGAAIDNAEDVRRALARSDGQVQLNILRDEKPHQLCLTPQITEDGPRLGVYLRQGVTGLGTVSWYDPDTGCFGSLGHGISGADGDPVAMTSGTVYDARVLSVKRGVRGQPGQLRGGVEGKVQLGAIHKNTRQGVFGETTLPFPGEALPVASQKEITTGSATIRSTVSGNRVQEYSVEILKIYPNGRNTGKNMLLKITDPQLLTATGGIVQGMSGSPIIQDGKLVGAVTHVLVNDPTTGYGIFIENMLDAAA